MSEILPCWMVYETDVEGRTKEYDLRAVYLNQQEAMREKSANAWTTIIESKCIRVPVVDGFGKPPKYLYYVLKYDQDINQLGSRVKERVKQAALAKLTEEEKKALGL